MADYTRDDGVTMDPDVVLERIRELIKRDLDRDTEGQPTGALAEDMTELCDLAQGLDAWLSKGGVPPKPWRPYGTSPDTRWGG